MSAPTINWEKIKSEVTRLSHGDELRKELNKIVEEIKTFDLQAHLSPSARQRLKDLEKRYGHFVVAINKAQRQFDREFQKVLRVVKRTKTEAEKSFKQAKKAAQTHKKKIKKASATLSKKVKKKTTKRTRKPRKTTTSA